MGFIEAMAVLGIAIRRPSWQAEARIAVDHTPTPVVDMAVERARREVPLRHPLPPDQAAKRFLAFLQAEGIVGDQPWAGRKGIWQLYLWHCQEDGLTPIPDNMLGAAIGKIMRKRLVRDRSSGTLRRLTMYCVPIPRKRAA